MKTEFDRTFTCPRLHQFKHIMDGFIQLRLLIGRLSLFAKCQHVHHQIINPALVLFDHMPAFAYQLFIVIIETHIDQITATTNPLQNVLNMMAQGRNRLSHRRHPLGFDKRVLETMIFYGERRLSANRNQQPQLILTKTRCFFTRHQ